MNQVAMNSMRFMLEAAGIEAEGASGAIKLQGLTLAWGRVLQTWLDDDEPTLSKTMAELDRVPTRGERAVAGLDRVSALTSPFSALAKAAFDVGRRARRGGGSRPARKVELGDEDVTAL
jgi:hypothetical protein